MQSNITPVVEGFFDDASNSISYIVKDPTSKSCALIDSVLDFDMASGRTSFEQADKMIAHVEKNELEVEWILEQNAMLSLPCQN